MVLCGLDSVPHLIGGHSTHMSTVWLEEHYFWEGLYFVLFLELGTSYHTCPFLQPLCLWYVDKHPFYRCWMERRGLDMHSLKARWEGCGFVFGQNCFLKIAQIAKWRENKLQRRKAQDKETCQLLSQPSRRVGRVWAEVRRPWDMREMNSIIFGNIQMQRMQTMKNRAWGQSRLSNSDFLRTFQPIGHFYVIE